MCFGLACCVRTVLGRNHLPWVLKLLTMLHMLHLLLLLHMLPHLMLLLHLYCSR